MKRLTFIITLTLITVLFLALRVPPTAAQNATCDEVGEVCCTVAPFSQKKCVAPLACDILQSPPRCVQPSCGTQGLPCCTQPIGGNKFCYATDLECAPDNTCQLKNCGGPGQTCCPTGVELNKCNLLELECKSDNTCGVRACGHLGETCCQPSGLFSFPACFDATHSCQGGTCQVSTCGNLGQACCSGMFNTKTCNLPTLRCDGTTCVSSGSIVPTKLCEYAGPDGSAERAACIACVGEDPEGNKVWTAFGCFSASPQGFIQTLLSFAIGIAGGIAFLMILYGAFVVMTSVGNPERLTSGKEIITSAVAGLLLVVFSAIILRIIGMDILGGLPGFGG